MIEPAARQNAICFGPNTSNFRDVVETLLENDAARVVADEQEMFSFVEQMMSDLEARTQMAQRAMETVVSNRGTTRRTLEFLGKAIMPDSNLTTVQNSGDKRKRQAAA